MSDPIPNYDTVAYFLNATTGAMYQSTIGKEFPGDPCLDGREIRRECYPGLWAVLEQFEKANPGDPDKPFVLPDLRGRLIVGGAKHEAGAQPGE